jgi:hypothetical protein
MGQYKVPQNVEAEDRILGPLTFRQFIYALIGFGWAMLCFGIFRAVPVVLFFVGFPPTLLFLLLAFFRRDGQDFEQLLIAMVGFFSTSHFRLWVKEEVAETFHIQPTKKEDEITQRNPELVRSELEKLTTLIDSRGWNLPADVQPTHNPVALPTTPHEDRIVPPPAPATPHAPDGVAMGDDILDMKHSPLAQNLAQLLAEAADDVKNEAVSQMSEPQPHRRREHQPVPSTSGVTPLASNDIVRLATQNDDISVSRLAAHATRIAPPGAMQSSEVESQAHGS